MHKVNETHAVRERCSHLEAQLKEKDLQLATFRQRIGAGIAPGRQQMAKELMNPLPPLPVLHPPPLADSAHDLTLAAPHGLGPLADDWAAIEVWLAAIAGNSRSRSDETIKTYRFHLAKLRWYCEQELRRAPAAWSAQDVHAFKAFLSQLPERALCSVGAKQGQQGYTPFRKRPGASSQVDILRFTHAMFKALHGTGYIRLNPMILIKTGRLRRLDKSRAIDLDMFALVLRVMDDLPREKQTAHQIHLRDRFIFICLRESGLRASELVGAKMRALRPLSDPKSRKTYWVLKVEEDSAKDGKERTVPVTPALLDALIAYRRAFGLVPLPDKADEQHGLILSVRTHPLAAGTDGGMIKNAADRRYFGAWRDVGTRFGLHGIVKGRIREAVRHLKQAGETAAAKALERVSCHWLRHMFATAALLGGQDLRVVASALGHASVTSTMLYTEQDVLEQIRSWEGEQPGSVAQVTSAADASAGLGGVS
jgi:site-specific recombinase XerD